MGGMPAIHGHTVGATPAYPRGEGLAPASTPPQPKMVPIQLLQVSGEPAPQLRRPQPGEKSSGSGCCKATFCWIGIFFLCLAITHAMCWGGYGIGHLCLGQCFRRYGPPDALVNSFIFGVLLFIIVALVKCFGCCRPKGIFVNGIRVDDDELCSLCEEWKQKGFAGDIAIVQGTQLNSRTRTNLVRLGLRVRPVRSVDEL